MDVPGSISKASFVFEGLIYTRDIYLIQTFPFL